MMYFILYLMCFLGTSWGNSLAQVQKMARHSMEANKVRLRVGSENMANAETPGYAPKEVTFKSTYDRKEKIPVVAVKKIQKNNRKQKQVYQPHHPQADEQGYVTMPDTSPLLELMNIQESKLAYERGLKVYETATELRRSSIALIGGR
jgi:flagellar basal-body rod protein FlgC